MFTTSFSKSALAALAFLTLAACQSAEERAEEYFQSGLELVEAGDLDRAVVELRNVLQLDGDHLAARMALAEVFMTQGNQGGAYQQYLAVAERNPEELEARRSLAELAFALRNWEEFVRHGAVAVELSPDDPRVQAIDLGLQYREASLAGDGPTRDALLASAEELLPDLPDNLILNNILIDSYVRNGTVDKALVRVDALIEASPENRQLYNQRLAMLSQMQDTDAIEAQLRDMVELFPGDEEVQGMLYRFYVEQQELDEAEAFLREISDPASEDTRQFLNLIGFVSEVHGAEAARVEIERAIEVNPNPTPFRAMLALLDFQTGAQDKAIADMEALLAGINEETEGLQNIRTTLAQMLLSTGNEVRARQLVEEILTEDTTNVEALKMQARWQLQADEMEAAISNLRLALDSAPEDVEAMNLMSEAFARQGDTNLSREFLSLAVEASGNAPGPSLRYARVLMEQERYRPAEDVLLPALRRSPENIELLAALGELYLRMSDASRATQVADTLRRLDTEQATTLANELQARILAMEGGSQAALQFLENLASQEDAALRDKLLLLRARVSAGETAAAVQMAQDLVAENPENLALKQVLANTQIAAGDLEDARITLRELTSAVPQDAIQAWLQLIRIAGSEGDTDEADAVIEEALNATGDHPAILFAKASRLEEAGDIDGTIEIFETLYEQQPDSTVLANNIASLLATYKSDDESLERAALLARRLRDTEVPSFQDTYGWIAFRQGNAEEALPYLESAAAGLPQDPVVQIHLGEVYAALGRNEEALEQLQKGVNIAGPADTRPKIEDARAEIPRLRTLVEN